MQWIRVSLLNNENDWVLGGDGAGITARMVHKSVIRT